MGVVGANCLGERRDSEAAICLRYTWDDVGVRRSWTKDGIRRSEMPGRGAGQRLFRIYELAHRNH